MIYNVNQNLEDIFWSVDIEIGNEACFNSFQDKCVVSIIHNTSKYDGIDILKKNNDRYIF